ncbi:MAG: SDR family NAD(P)-dependent oxidoreductase [Burkholderiales bacterium]
MDNFNQRVAIITGGARGLGFAVAQTLAMEGAKVVIADNDCALDGGPEDSVVADAAVERLDAKAPGCAIAFKHNLTAPGAAEACVALAKATYGHVDIVINNAAITRDAPIFQSQVHDLEAVIANNLSAPLALLAAATPVMRTQSGMGRRPGAIVNVISTAGLIGNPSQAAYAAAKAGMVGMTRCVAMDLRANGIICNAVAPYAATRLTQALPVTTEEEREYKEHAQRVPLSYAANFVAFLCTSHAARITGQVFGVRAREIFLFTQPAPAMQVFAEPGSFDPELYTPLIHKMADEFTDLRSEREIFNIKPVL